MAYTDQKFYTRQFVNVKPTTSWGTATASGAGGHDLTNVVELPKFIRRSAITAVRLKVTTIPNAASTALLATLLNGTSVIGTAVLTTAALAGTVDFVITTAANGTLAADTEPTINLTGTSTASAAAAGAYDTFIEFNELFS